jgi:large subunit ribosomal protein L6
MSRISKIPIIIPSNVSVSISGNSVKVSGPKGDLAWITPAEMVVEISEGKVIISSKAEEVENLLGLTRSLIANMVTGVSEGFAKVLELNGTGYRANVAGTDLNLALGFSHPVVIAAPAGIAFEVKENKITVRGSDKSLVGEMAAKIRSLRPVDPYKAKGFKYEGEIIIKKAGKTAKAGATAAAK